MNNRTSRGLYDRLARMGKASLMGLATTALLATSAAAQFQSIHGFVYPATYPGYVPGAEDVKNYCTKVIPGTGNESVMAGTVWQRTNMPWLNAPHFLRLDGSGNIVSSVHYNDPNYLDQRVVDIQLDESTSYQQSFITLWSRPQSGYVSHEPQPTPARWDRDGFRVLRVDNNSGVILDEITVFSNDALPGGQDYGNSLYPISTMYYDDGTNKRLYVCGIYTPDDTRCPTCPIGLKPSNYWLGTFDAKQGFVMSIDIDMNNGPKMTLVNTLFFDYTPPQNNSGVDYDMPLRMKRLNSTGDIVITGSCNAYTNTGLNPGNTRGGTMFLVVDPALNIVDDRPIISLGMDGYGDNEYGIDIVEKSSTDIYILGNGYTQGGERGENSSYGFDQKPNRMQVSRFSQIGRSYFQDLNRYESNITNQWFTNAITPENPNSGDYRFTVAGLAAQDCGAALNAPSYTNVDPIIVDFELNSTITSLQDPLGNAGQANITLFETQSGFGTTGTANYNTLGQSPSNMYFYPKAADKDGVGGTVVMSAPRYEPNWGELGLKIIHANYSSGSTYYDASCGTTQCSVNFNAVTVDYGSVAAQTVPVTVISYYENTFWDDILEFQAGDCNSGSPNYKPTGVDNIANSNEFKLYPNPATTEVHVGLANSVSQDAKVSVVLMNMYGQSVGALYSGKASGLNANTTLHLPSVATGIYMVQIIVDGQLAHTEKLAVE